MVGIVTIRSSIILGIKCAVLNGFMSGSESVTGYNSCKIVDLFKSDQFNMGMDVVVFVATITFAC